MFFLSSLRNSASAGRVRSSRLSTRITLSNGALTCSPGAEVMRSTRPKRVTTPYSVTSTAKQEAISAHRPQAAPRIASIGTSAPRLFPPSPKPVALIDTALFASARGKRLHEPEVEILHLAGTWPNDLLYAGQHGSDRFELKTVHRQLWSCPVRIEPERECGRVAFGVLDVLVARGERLLKLRRRFALRLVHLLDGEDVGAIDRAQLVFLRARDIAEAVVHCVWRMHIEQPEGDHLDPDPIKVELRLRNAGNLALDILACGCVDG